MTQRPLCRRTLTAPPFSVPLLASGDLVATAAADQPRRHPLRPPTPHRASTHTEVPGDALLVDPGLPDHARLVAARRERDDRRLSHRPTPGRSRRASVGRARSRPDAHAWRVPAAVSSTYGHHVELAGEGQYRRVREKRRRVRPAPRLDGRAPEPRLGVGRMDAEAPARAEAPRPQAAGTDGAERSWRSSDSGRRCPAG